MKMCTTNQQARDTQSVPVGGACPTGNKQRKMMTKTDTETPTLVGILRRHMDSGDTDEQIIAAVLTRDDLPQLVKETLAWRITVMRRAHTRSIETKVFAELKKLEKPTRQDRAEVRRMLATSGFQLPAPGARWVSWLDATADEHGARSGWLTGQSDALLETAARHLEAAADIRRAKVTCLRDLDEAAAA